MRQVRVGCGALVVSIPESRFGGPYRLTRARCSLTAVLSNRARRVVERYIPSRPIWKAFADVLRDHGFFRISQTPEKQGEMSMPHSCGMCVYQAETGNREFECDISRRSPFSNAFFETPRRLPNSIRPRGPRALTDLYRSNEPSGR